MVIRNRPLRQRVYRGNTAQLFGKSSKRRGAPKLVGQNAFASIEHRIESRRVRIGSAAGNDLILPHRSVSARHAVIRQTLGRCYIRDLGSTNGTFLNGRRIETEQPLRAGDELRFGAARFAMVAAKNPGPSTLKYIAAALGLILLAGVGYLAVEFVNNWENLEKLSATPPKPGSSTAANEAPEAAPAGMSEARANPAASVPGAKPTPVAAAPAWLAAINEYRAGVNLPPVVEDPKLSDADRKHAIYVVKNYEDKVGAGHLLGAEMHDEEKGNPWYTPEGHDAGEQSDVNQLWGHDRPPSPTWALDNWISGPFHRLWILNPRLHRVGYGEFCEKKYCVTALDLGSGSEPPRGASQLASPLEFPADKSITTLNSFAGEWPTPLTACAGFSFPAGLPATIQLGTLVEAKLSEYQITREGHGVESCGIDATTYQNPVDAEQERGRAILRELSAAIIIPRYPLHPGRYSVTATLNNHAYQWSFTVAGSVRAAAQPPGKDALEAALRAGYGRASESDSEGRAEYERDIKEHEAAAAASAASVAAASAAAASAAASNAARAASNAARAAANAAITAKMRELQRHGETAFPAGPGAITPVGAGQWLAELNRDRAAAGLSPVVEDPALSDGDLKHAKYMVMNYPTPFQMGAAMHTEDSSKAGYTPEGLVAARGGNVAPAWYPPSPLPQPPIPTLLFINGWLAGPFHRPTLLYPDLHKVGFGEFCKGRACAAGLYGPESMRPVAEPVTFAQPLLFPPQKYPVALTDLPTEWPDPITACLGYASPVGLPITIQIGTRIDARLSLYALTQDSKPVEACGFDSTTYVNPTPHDQEHARTTLHLFGEVVIIPRKPLERGATYEVSATVNDHPYQWSFTVSR